MLAPAVQDHDGVIGSGGSGGTAGVGAVAGGGRVGAVAAPIKVSRQSSASRVLADPEFWHAVSDVGEWLDDVFGV